MLKRVEDNDNLMNEEQTHDMKVIYLKKARWEF